MLKWNCRCGLCWRRWLFPFHVLLLHTHVCMEKMRGEIIFIMIVFTYIVCTRDKTANIHPHLKSERWLNTIFVPLSKIIFALKPSRFFSTEGFVVWERWGEKKEKKQEENILLPGCKTGPGQISGGHFLGICLTFLGISCFQLPPPKHSILIFLLGILPSPADRPPC